MTPFSYYVFMSKLLTAASDSNARTWYDKVYAMLKSQGLTHDMALSDYIDEKPFIFLNITNILKAEIGSVIDTAPEWMHLKQDPRSKVFALVEPGYGSSECDLKHSKKENLFQWLIDIDPEKDDVKEFLNTLYHELVHVEQNLKIVMSKSQKFYEELPIGPHNTLYKPFGPNTDAYKEDNDSDIAYYSDPIELDAYAMEAAKKVWSLIRQKFPKSQWSQEIDNAVGPSLLTYLSAMPSSKIYLSKPELKSKYLKKYVTRLKRYSQGLTQ